MSKRKREPVFEILNVQPFAFRIAPGPIYVVHFRITQIDWPIVNAVVSLEGRVVNVSVVNGETTGVIELLTTEKDTYHASFGLRISSIEVIKSTVLIQLPKFVDVEVTAQSGSLQGFALPLADKEYPKVSFVTVKVGFVSHGIKDYEMTDGLIIYRKSIPLPDRAPYAMVWVVDSELRKVAYYRLLISYQDETRFGDLPPARLDLQANPGLLATIATDDVMRMIAKAFGEYFSVIDGYLVPNYFMGTEVDNGRRSVHPKGISVIRIPDMERIIFSFEVGGSNYDSSVNAVIVGAGDITASVGKIKWKMRVETGQAYKAYRDLAILHMRSLMMSRELITVPT